jgi:D-inositol-3-phosphate glycosyltransferase
MSVYLRELTAGLADFPGVRVDILTRAQDAVCVEKDISPQIRVVQLKGGPEKPVDRTNLYEFIPEFSENLGNYMLRQKQAYDIVHSHYWLSGLAGVYIKHKLGLPLVHSYHTLGFKKRRVLGENEHESRDSTERHIARVSDAIVSPSSDERDSLVREYGIAPSKVEVVQPGVNPRLFYPGKNTGILKNLGIQPGDRVLLYVGRIEPVKGLACVIRSLKTIKGKNPSLFRRIKLLIVGGGEREELEENGEVLRIESQISQIGIENKVRFLGSIDHSRLRQYYAAADALLVPSLYESFGLVTVEALACGIPIIVSRVGKMRDIVKEGKNGFSFRPDDPLSLYRALERMESHRDRLWTHASIRRDVLQRFSWDRTAEKTYRIFKNLLKCAQTSRTKFLLDESLPPA